ncbi:MAG: TlpA family protein disulfide reductase [Lewinellaceae bacterium]|nr:TlpA family protein disulfide reductase [Lewinellaceae bacterium]
MQSRFWKLGFVVLGLVIAYAVYQYRQPRFIAGETAPDFTTTLANGETVQLSDLRGKYVLLQFWGSWCGPCRAENRHLVPLYEQFHDQGFDIFSVAIESNERSWKRAVEMDGLYWKYHTVEYNQFKGPLARQFNIHSIPTTFLINPDGRIMGVNLKTDQLEKMLQTALASR